MPVFGLTAGVRSSVAIGAAALGGMVIAGALALGVEALADPLGVGFLSLQALRQKVMRTAAIKGFFQNFSIGQFFSIGFGIFRAKKSQPQGLAFL